jgi:hypothetical protein
MYPGLGHKANHYREPSTRKIDIACSETELKMIKDHYLSFTCERRDELRTLLYSMSSDLSFSREEERMLFQLLQRIDRIVERNVMEMRKDAEKAMKDPNWAKEKYLQKRAKAGKRETSENVEIKMPHSYEWRIGIFQEISKIDSLWPFKRNTEVRMRVEITIQDEFQDHPVEKWVIERDPGAIAISQDGVLQPESHTDIIPSGETLPVRVIISGQSFPGRTGLRILKLRHETCPFPQWQEAWDVLTPLTFREITEQIKDVERRRTAIAYLGIERLMTQIESKMIREETIEKITTWVDADGQIREHRFSDTYSLHRVRWTTLFGDLTDETNLLMNSNWNKPHNHHFVKCKCASTGKEYILWVDLRQVYRTNHPEVTRQSLDDIGHWRIERLVDPIEAIAWTFQTRLAKGSIEAIIRQGDCILMRPVINPVLDTNRHLTGEEYRTLMRSES